jgi:outer membrane murein-binding lipoprotein Lpp
MYIRSYTLMRKQTNYKLPEELIAALQEKAATERVTATDLVIQALNTFLGINQEEGSHIAISIAELANKVEKLENKLKEIEPNKHVQFMHHSHLSEASNIDIRIDSNTTADRSRDFEGLVKKFEEVAQQNQDLRARVDSLESLIQEYICQDFRTSSNNSL